MITPKWEIPPPDYVFGESYECPSLEETQDFVRINKHLPGVPSAKQLTENGVNIVELNMILLKKIEELYLHSFDMKKKIAHQEKVIEKMKSQIDKVNRR